MPAPLRTTISSDSLSSATASSKVLYSFNFCRLSPKPRGAGEAEDSRLPRRGDADECRPILPTRGVLRMRDGDKDILRPGDNGGKSHFALAVGVLGTFCSAFAASSAVIVSRSVMIA